MKVNSKTNRDISFNGFSYNKILKKGLEFAADNGALFAATTTLILSGGIRTASIFAAPNTDKENKKVASAKSIMSSLAEFFITLGLSLPLVKGIKHIEKNPQKFLTDKSLHKLKDGAESLSESKTYSFIAQTLKLGLGMAVAVPKAVLTVLGMPYVLEYVFNTPQKDLSQKNSKELSFKGKDNKLHNTLSRLFNNESLQNFAQKHKDSNFPMHITAIKDTITTGLMVHCFNKSQKIDEDRKPAVSANAIIATGLSIVFSYIIDKALDKPTNKMIAKFKEKNIHDPKLPKYLEGIKIAKPILVMGVVYYTIIPLFATYFADRAAKSNKFTNAMRKV